MCRRIAKILGGCLVLLFVFSVRAQEKPERKEIFINVFVRDARGNFASGLESKDFQITVDKKPQQISSFTADEQPATVVFLIDSSGSQGKTIAPLVEQIKRFVKNANPKNEYVVIAFDAAAQLIAEKTNDVVTLEEKLDRLAAALPKGNTAFYDAVYAAIEKAESGKHEKKVLIACSDGKDNQSLFRKLGDVKNLLKRSGVLFYGVNYLNDDSRAVENLQGQAVLSELSETSGGKFFYAPRATEAAEIFDRFALELKNQYRIGF